MDANDSLRWFELQMMMDSTRNTLDLILALERYEQMHDGTSYCGDLDHPNRVCAALRAEIQERTDRFEAEQRCPPDRWWT